MSNYNTTLQSNNTDLQAILDTINDLPDAGGVDLAELTNPGAEADLLSGKELIDEEGNIITGTMTNNGAISKSMDGINTKSVTVPAGYTSGGTVSLTDDIDNEVDTQADLISQITTALEGKSAGSAPTLQEKTVTPSTSAQTVTPDSGYDGLNKVMVNAMPTATQATPSITVSSSGLITASATQTAGYVSAGTKSGTKQLTTQAAKTITPTTSSQTAVASGRYTTGAVTVAGDANLIAGNIKSGVSIFGVAGSYEGSSGGSSGGGSIETCAVELTYESPFMEAPIIYYTGADMALHDIDFNSGGIISVVKNTIVYIINWSSMSECSGEASLINYNNLTGAYFVSGDCTLTYFG